MGLFTFLAGSSYYPDSRLKAIVKLDKSTKTEMKGRTTEIDAINKENALYDRLHIRLLALFSQSKVTVGSRRITLFKFPKIRMANASIDKILDGEIDIRKDAIVQAKLVDREDD